jgi:amino acid adenylation domain-containing protein
MAAPRAGATVAAIVERAPGRPALAVGGRTWCYGELIERASGISARCAEGDAGPHGLVALLAYRSFTAYAGVLAAHLGGCGYVPLNPKFPAARTQSMFLQSGTGTVVVGLEAAAVLLALLDSVPRGLTVIGPEIADFGDLPGRYGGHRFVPAGDIAARTVPSPRPIRAGQAAYLLFTSGSTGRPKGVPVSFSNLDSYVDYVAGRYGIAETDRASQCFDMTFDLSAHDMFVTWAGGGCLLPLPDAALLAPARFIRDHALTVWFSVPSTAMLMARARTLMPGVFPSLRLSFFCGEPLPVASAAAWSAAAPGSRVVNLYGPTEATIAIAEYEWRGQASEAESRYGTVPIGTVFATQQACVVEGEGGARSPAPRGELYLSGSQVTAGYLNDAAKTAEHYGRLPGRGDTLWYRTGDIVERREDGCMFFVGRKDDQVKINGFRVELQEIDGALRAAAGTDLAVGIAWPRDNGAPRGIVACLGGEVRASDDAILGECRRLLPPYMQPARIVRLPMLPLNANGKIDRRALQSLLDEERRAAAS